MKLEENMYISLQIGKFYRKQIWYIPLITMAIIAGENFKLSKSQVKRLLKQGGIKINIFKHG